MREDWGDFIEREMMRDAERIMEEVNADPALRDAQPPEELRERLFAQIHEHEKQRLYSQLSDADKELLRLGKIYKKRRKWRKCLILLAALLTVLAVGTVCIGEKETVFDFMYRVLNGEVERVVDSENIEPIVYIEESEVFKEIERTYGFTPVKLEYLPDNTAFYEATFSEVMQYINIIYETENDTSLIYIIRPNYRSSSFGTTIEDKYIQEYQMNLYDVEISVTEYEIEESGENRWSIYFEYQNVQYQIRVSNIGQEEVEKIVRGLRFVKGEDVR